MTLDDWSYPMYLHMATADLSPFAIVRLDPTARGCPALVSTGRNEPCSDRGRLIPSKAQRKSSTQRMRAHMQHTRGAIPVWSGCMYPPEAVLGWLHVVQRSYGIYWYVVPLCVAGNFLCGDHTVYGILHAQQCHGRHRRAIRRCG